MIDSIGLGNAIEQLSMIMGSATVTLGCGLYALKTSFNKKAGPAAQRVGTAVAFSTAIGLASIFNFFQMQDLNDQAVNWALTVGGAAVLGSLTCRWAIMNARNATVAEEKRTQDIIAAYEAGRQSALKEQPSAAPAKEDERPDYTGRGLTRDI